MNFQNQRFKNIFLLLISIGFVLSANAQKQFTLYNVVGQPIASGLAEGKQEVLLPSGIYIVKIDKTVTKLIVN